MASICTNLLGTHSNFEDAKATVSYADLNLGTEEGARVLYQRLQYASKEIRIVMASPKISESSIIKSSSIQLYTAFEHSVIFMQRSFSCLHPFRLR